MNHISPLDNHTISLLRSGVYLHSFTHAIKALTEISTKSNPTTISVSIDPHSGFICVDDNGIGIDKRLVRLFGSFDSKSCVSLPNSSHDPELDIISYLSLSQHRILDSLAHLSSLDICSRQSDSSYTHQTLFKEGQVIFSAPAKTSKRHNRGTTTTVRNLFYNLPVRQIKETDQNRLQTRLKRLWNESKIVIQSLAIIHPNITFTLRNSSTNHLGLFDQSSGTSDQSSFYRISKTGSPTSTFGKVFGHQFVRDSIPLDLTMDGFKVNGLFAKNRHASRSSQLIYLDKVLIDSNSSLHKTLTSLFARLVSQDASPVLVEQGLTSTQISSSYKSGTSTVDRYPVYLILFSKNCSPSPHQQPPDDHNEFFFDEKEQDLIPRVEEKLNKILTRIFSQVFPAIPTTNTLHSSVKEYNPKVRIIHPTKNRNTLDSRWPVVKRARLSNESSSSKPQISHPLRHGDDDDGSCVESERSEQLSSKQRHRPYSSSSKIHPSEKKINVEQDGNIEQSIHPPDKENTNVEESVNTISNLKSRFQYKYARSNSDATLVRERVQILAPVINNVHPNVVNRRRISNLNTKSKDKQPIGSTGRSSSDPKRQVHRSPEVINNKAFKPSLSLTSRFQYVRPTSGSMDRLSIDSTNPIRRGEINQESSNSNNACGSSQSLKPRNEHYHEKTELHHIDLSKFSNPSTFTVIGQLDLKFIIVKINGSIDQQGQTQGGDGELIVAFDQHAVHERIRIEKFLKDMCTGKFKTKKLNFNSNNNNNLKFDQEGEVRGKGIKGNLDENSVPILVNRIEYDGLIKYKKQFERWGIIYESMEVVQTRETRYHYEGDEDGGEEEEEEEFKQIYMVAVPEMIWERVKSDGVELVKKILKGCLGFFEDRGRDLSLNLGPFDPVDMPPHTLDPMQTDSLQEDDWFKFVKDCPTVLVDLLNSKACRGSIMFGDELNDTVTTKLIVKLSRTHLPFSCAHGRPTCYPLFKLGQHLHSTSQSGPPSSSLLNVELFTHLSNDRVGVLQSETFTNGLTSNYFLKKSTSNINPPCLIYSPPRDSHNHRIGIHWSNLESSSD